MPNTASTEITVGDAVKVVRAAALENTYNPAERWVAAFLDETGGNLKAKVLLSDVQAFIDGAAEIALMVHLHGIKMGQAATR